tara:strand:- start:1374 stop:1934 length:561 start_codon:yes stop_codon:yes gene_type:complete
MTKTINKSNNCCFCNDDFDPSQIVVGRGNPMAKIMMIGEAPGAEEDKLGVPFIGRSGKLLDKLLIEVGLDPLEDIYFCNLIKFRPPKNRRPSKKEIELHFPWLKQQIKLIDPKVIVLIGATSVETILGIKGGISNLRGNWLNWENKLVMPVFHPSYLLRNPSQLEGKPISLTKSDLIKIRYKILQN